MNLRKILSYLCYLCASQLLACGVLFFGAAAFAQQNSTNRTIVSERFDTLSVRTTPSLWRFGLEGSAGAGWSMGGVEMAANVNNATIRAVFAEPEFAAVQSWNAGATASFGLLPDVVSIGVALGIQQQTSYVRHVPVSADEYKLIHNVIRWNALKTSVDAELHNILSTPIYAKTRIHALWTTEAAAQMSYVRNNSSPPTNSINTSTPAIPLMLPPVICSIAAEIAYPLRPTIQGFGGITAQGRFTPTFGIEWLPNIFSSQNASWGALTLRLGCAWTLETLRVDTLSVQPFIRAIPIALLPETPLADIIREEEGAAGRVVSPRELTVAVLEDRIIIYRPDDTTLRHGIPAEALEIFRDAVQYIRSGAQCRITLTVPTRITTSLVPKAEASLRQMGDYLLNKGIDNASIEAGLAENVYSSGEAWQLHIRIARAVR
ncbi:MAG: hypothetical protein MUF71_07420 [Candidatus Kapabacteria bacterium]|jgi:hypothetical protein|nr:hypothetical protein [Candidatus Kapabacteria bacterium]